MESIEILRIEKQIQCRSEHLRSVRLGCKQSTKQGCTSSMLIILNQVVLNKGANLKNHEKKEKYELSQY